MPLYRYRAITAEGRVVTGEYAGDDVASVRRYLLSANLFPEKVSRALNLLPQRSGLRTGRLLFIHSFELLLASGLDTVDALAVATSKVKNRALKQSLEDVVASVRNGRSLADAFNDHVRVFGHQWIAALKAGEASGNLKESVHLYRQLNERLDEISRKVSAAMTYPLILVAMIVVVLAVLLTVVVPRLSEGYHSLGGELPALTRWVLFASESFPYLAGGLLLLFVLGRQAFKYTMAATTRAGYKRRLLDSIPLMGKVRIEFRTVNVAATLSMLMLAGHSLHEALKLIAVTETDPDLVSRLRSAAVSAEEGHGVVSSLQANDLLPDTALQLLEAGERTGELGRTLEQVSRFYLGSLDLSVGRFVSVLEPILMLVIGLVIGVVVIAVYLPIFSMTQVIG
ncbi:type II secretion system F family protein [Marinobacter sp. DUT-1]|uniref:type II secretion system F family protein n=1 Tax=Marinobacter sp. DUT-1 TaxID=3412037 RepID=UPI003D162765